jgi:cell wall-associated NlpC family hydrolase
MTSNDNRRIRRLTLAGTAGVLAIGLGAVVYPAWADERAQQAVMLEAPTTTVSSAVADAEAAAVAARAAAEAQAAAEAAHAAQVQAQTSSVVDLAYAQVGDGYSMGASGPSVFDCSGLTMWVYNQAMGVSLPHNTHAQWNAIDDTWYAGGKQPQPGDLVFFFNNGADHVGIYVGDGKMVHAANPRTGVTVDSIYDGYWGNKLTGFGRIIH